MNPLAERTVVHMLREGAARHPARVAVRDEDEELDYRGLLDASCRAAQAFRELGVDAGDRVLILMDNSVDHVLAWFGSALAGAIEVPLNTASMPPQIEFIAEDCGATVLVVDEHYLPRVVEIADRLVHLRHVVVRGDADTARGHRWRAHPIGVLREAAAAAPVELAPGDPSGIMYTSGTTGDPKGVLVSHAQTYGRNGPLLPGAPARGDVCLVPMPIYHVFGQCRGLYNTLIAGGTVVLRRRFSASAFWDQCREHGVTFVPLVGVMASYLLAQAPRPDDRHHRVRAVVLGTTIAEVEDFKRRFGVAEAYVSYGLTEAGGVLVGTAEADGCGRLRDDFEARLVDEHGLPVPDGDAGELVLRPREPWTTMLGYWNRPEETVRKWRNLWLHTGDLMRRRPDGVYVFSGRLADRIRCKGENVAPVAVEAQLETHPAVVECAVVGVDTTDAGPGEQEVLAAVVLEPGSRTDPAELVTYLAARLPHFAVPRYYRVIDALPRTDSTRRVQRGPIAAGGVDGAWDRVGDDLDPRAAADLHLASERGRSTTTVKES